MSGDVDKDSSSEDARCIFFFLEKNKKKILLVVKWGQNTGLVPLHKGGDSPWRHCLAQNTIKTQLSMLFPFDGVEVNHSTLCK